MEILMPSEIARLVFGYLKEEGCEDAAQLFLQTSPRLEECRAFVSQGKNFNTKVSSDMSLTDILEQYCMATNMVHEKLKQYSDNKSIKKTMDLVDQLKYLLDGSRSQRFVVNINVPSQSNSQTGDSPILSGSNRKRRYSNTEREHSKKLKMDLEKLSKQTLNQCFTITEATPSDNLPGNYSCTGNTPGKLKNMKENQKNSIYTSNKDDTEQINRSKSTNLKQADSNNLAENNLEKDRLKKCSMGTSTEELHTFTNTEVQTTPLETNDPLEMEWHDEPIENLSLLTKELLSRTELQERIAENINRVIYPANEENLPEAGAPETNISLVSELNNAIKTTVSETENDPLFEQFLSEVIGKIEETDTSPDEDRSPEVDFEKNQRPSTQQNDAENALHDQNAAAVMSIINANIINQNKNRTDIISVGVSETSAINTNVPAVQINDKIENNRTDEKNNVYIDQNKIGNVTENIQDVPVLETDRANINNTEHKICRNNRKRLRTVKIRDTTNLGNSNVTKSIVTTMQENIVSLETIETVPTFVYATKEETKNTYLYNNYGNIKKPSSQYIPIRPKVEEPAMYLKTVNVPVKVMSKLTGEESSFIKNTTQSSLPSIKTLVQKRKFKKKRVFSSNTHQKKFDKIEIPLDDEISSLKEDLVIEPKSVQTENQTEENTEVPASMNESLTLYGTGSNASMCLNSDNMPIINFDDSLGLSSSRLSPILKFLDKKDDPQQTSEAKLNDTEQLKLKSENNVNQNESKLNHNIIVKHTPNSIMKSRAKNYRLSLSTPRKRNNHVRALDFNTPMKIGCKNSGMLSCESKQSIQSKSTCRATLFKSPTLNQITQEQTVQIRNPVTSLSPLPKLSSCWEKITGMGMILGSVSPENKSEGLPTKSVSQKETKSWDTDLRASLVTDENKQLETFQKKFPKATKIKGTEEKNHTSACENEKNKTGKKDVELKQSIDLGTSLNLSNTSASSLNTSNTSNKKPMKKYAKLKTITTTVTKVVSGSIDVTPALGTKVVAAIKTSPQPIQKHTFPHLLDLETPRKLDNMLMDIPPTPRLLSPSNTTLSTFLKFSDDSTKIKKFIATPEFPPTPCIVFTPHPSDKTMNDSKNDCLAANYYQPEEKPNQNNEDNNNCSETKEIQDASAHSSEIIQFEVIKENLPKKDAEKELKIASTSKDLSNDTNANANYVSRTTIVEETVHISHCHNSTMSDSDSSDSDSSSSCNSSQSSCSSNSNSSSTSNSPKSQREKSTPLKAETDSRTAVSETPVKNSLKLLANALQDNSKQEFAKNELISSKTEVSPVTDTTEKKENKEGVKKETGESDKEIIDLTVAKVPSNMKMDTRNIENAAEVASKLIENNNSQENCIKSIGASKVKVLSMEKMTVPVDLQFIPSTSELNCKTQLSKNLQLQLEEKKERLKSAFKNTNVAVQKPKAHSLMPLKQNKILTINKTDSNLEQRIVETEDLTTNEEKKKNKTLSLSARTKDTQVEDTANIKENEKPLAIEEHRDTRLDDPKLIHKLKVDQVKRDLFSDEESFDKRTTRSSSRRTVNAQKDLTSTVKETEKEISVEKHVEVPGVLECLQLVPANKNEQDHDSTNIANTSQSTTQPYLTLVYDENNCVKKRKRKYTNAEMELRLMDEDGESYVLKPTNFEEIFNFTPKPKKRIIQKKITTNVRKQKKLPGKLNNCDDNPYLKSLPKPLATSSPTEKALLLRKGKEAQFADEELLLNIKDKLRGKKKANTEDDKIKKSKSGKQYSEDMLYGIDLDNFLDQVHGV